MSSPAGTFSAFRTNEPTTTTIRLAAMAMIPVYTVTSVSPKPGSFESAYWAPPKCSWPVVGLGVS